MDKARAAWGEAMPDWIAALARNCDATSQGKAAKQLDRSASLVSTVLTKRYKGDMAAVQERVEGVFMAQTVDCPVKGVLSRDKCQTWRSRSRKFRSVNTEYLMMFKACKRCPLNSRPEADAEPGDDEEVQT